VKLKTVIPVLLVALASAACSSGHTSSSVDASYAEHYDSVAALKAHSSLIVEVTAKDMSHTHREGGTQPGASVLLTDSVVKIDKVFYDPQHQVTDAGGALTAATVVVYQTGGGTGSDAEIGDDPIFKQGEHLILFLRNGTEPQHYVAVGGPNGRFKAGNGKVDPFNSVSVQFSGDENGLTAALAATEPNS
jgi:hypothetical protein